MSPPPNSYNLGSDFEEGKFKSKGFCFGGGRDDMVVTGPLCELKNNKNPGPGDYESPKAKPSTSYSIRPKFDWESK